MKIAEVCIVKWDEQYVVQGEFGRSAAISRTFNSYGEALREMVRMATLEEMRYERGIGWNPDR